MKATTQHALVPPYTDRRPADGRAGAMSPAARWSHAGMAFLTLLILTGGGWYYRVEKQRLRHVVETDLAMVAEFKVEQIAEWRRERLADATVLADSPFLMTALGGWLMSPDTSVTAQILVRFRSLRDSYRYSDVLLVDTGGVVRLSLKGQEGTLHAEAMEALAAVLRNRKVCLADLHYGPGELPPHIDVVAPVLCPDGNTNAVGAVILRIDASQYLYPLVQSWPTASRSAETLLVRKDGNDVLFLNELRHMTKAALRLRLPLDRTDVPAVMAVSGKQGVVAGHDYRGVDVLSVLKRVPDSPWYMVAKIDTDEALSVWRQQSVLILLLLSGLIAVVVAAAGWVMQDRAKRQYRLLLAAETGLRRSEERYLTTLMSVGDGVIVTDANGCVELLNPCAETLTGWRQSEARGRPLHDVFRIVNETSRLTVESPVQRVMMEGLVVGLANHTILIARDGKEYPIADSGAPIRDIDGTIIGVVLVFRDQTTEQQAERALQKEGTNLRAIIAASPVGLLVIDGEEQVILANPAVERLFQTKLEDAGRRGCGDVIACVNRNKDPRGCGFSTECLPCPLRAGIRSVIASGQDVDDRNTEATIDTVAGPARRWLEFSARRIDFDGRKHVLVAIDDVTGKRQSESEMRRLLEQSDRDRRALLSILEDERQVEGRLHESEIRYRMLFEDAQDGMALAEADTGKLVDCNAALCRLVERNRADLVGQPQSILHPRDELMDGQSASFVQARSPDPGLIVEDRLLSASGRIVPVEIRAARITMAGHDYLVGVFRDISERRRMLAQMVQGERMSALGQMASGIAHDFNNCLMPILGFSDILLAHEDTRNNPGTLVSMLKDIRDAAGDARRVVQHFRDFYRPPSDAGFASVDMNDAIRRAVELTRSKWKEEAGARGVHITVHTDLSNVGSVLGQASDLREVLTNLIFNAVDAMPSGGEITLKSELAEGYVVVSVSDTGTGMSEETKKRCMEPFFTTKGEAGTGLGLSMTYGIIQRHHGTVEIASEPGHGTTIILRIPVEGSVSAGHGENKEEVTKRTLRILVVDDDHRVRAMLERLLAADGHVAEFAESGQEGIERLGKGKYDMLITDRALPVISGDEVAKAAKQLDEPPVIIMITGFGDIMKDEGEMPEGVDRLLSKPITVQELRKAISEVMWKRSAEGGRRQECGRV